ncbi:MAG: isocitrate lyase/phosphoenolpyruvate mutase family protein [Phycisphaerales bacterium]|nr:isocitrate lyase/phosphoenolpyruvate mutase family protein [Phycisphaerales bacterium]|tara:strand:- start:16030 stop:16869 length:840 start_codon:yes stop_codon:yes gene_type:complete
MSQGTVMCPGAFNALVGRAIAAAGFDAAYISGGATANAAGVPDVGMLTLTEVCRTIREVCEASGLPVVADADTGYGEEEMIVRAVHEYERAGAAGMHLEDQVFPKRCGHLDGKKLVTTERMVENIRAAVSAKGHGDFLIIARTDARSVVDLDEAIRRGIAYREAGADMIFPEGLSTAEEFAEFSSRCPGLLLANMTEFGKTPVLHIDRFSEMGYDLVIYPVTMQRIAMGAVTDALSKLRSDGDVAGIIDAMQTRQDLYDLLGYVPGEPWMHPSSTASKA